MRLFWMLLLWMPAVLWAASSPGYDFVEIDFSENNPDFKPYSNGDGYNLVGAISLPERNFAFLLYNDAPFRASGDEIGRGQEVDYWAIAGLAVTAAVYGAVALIVKADDVGLRMAETGRLGLTRSVGQALVNGMPGFLALLSFVGTLAMLWVGGGIIVHGTHEVGFDLLYDIAHGAEYAVASAIDALSGVLGWVTYAAVSAVMGLAWGFVIALVLHKVFKFEGAH